MRVKSTLPFTLAALAAVPQSSGKVWYTFTDHTDASCSSKPLGFFYVDMSSFVGLQATANSSTWGVAINASAQATTCAEFIAAQKTLPASYIAALRDPTSVTVEGDAQAVNVAVSVFESSPVDMIYVQGKLDDLKNGGCIADTETRIDSQKPESYGYVRVGCTTSDVPPPLPKSNDVFAVNAYAPTANGTNCYDKATAIIGVAADNKCRNETGILYSQMAANVVTDVSGLASVSTSVTARVCLQATCDGFTPSVSANLTFFGGEVGASLTAGIKADTCIAEDNRADGGKQMFTCKPGTGAAGGGHSLVSTEIKAEHAFEKGVKNIVDVAGRVALSLTPSVDGDVNLNVTVAPRSITATEAPENGINTFWKFEATPNASFSAQLAWNYDEATLDIFNYTAESLKWARWNTNTLSWDVKSETAVNTTSKSVILATSQFSEWTIVFSATSNAFATLPSAAVLLGAAILSLTFVF